MMYPSFPSKHALLPQREVAVTVGYWRARNDAKNSHFFVGARRGASTIRDGQRVGSVTAAGLAAAAVTTIVLPPRATAVAMKTPAVTAMAGAQTINNQLKARKRQR